MYTQKSGSQTAEELHVNLDSGLSPEEASARLTTYGKNELEKEKVKSFAVMFLEQLNTPLIFVLILAAGISILLKEYSDACIVITVILLNSIIGVLQEGKAQKALEALKQMTSPSALVKRGNSRRTLSTRRHRYFGGWKTSSGRPTAYSRKQSAHRGSCINRRICSCGKEP